MSTETIGLYGMVKIDGADVGKRQMQGVREGFEASGHAADRASRRWQAAGRALHGVVDVGRRLLGGVLAGGLIGGGVLAAGAIKAATGYEELQARMEAVTGSAEAMHRKLDFIQRVANPSNFTFKQLADAAVTMEAFGVNAERALPTVARLGMAFGAGDEQLAMLVRGLGDLSSGKFPEMDVLSAFGLNRQMFKDEGIKFDGQGQLESSAVEVFDALERIVSTRYGDIFDKMARTSSAKLASLQDTWERFQRTLGDGIMRVLGPSLEVLTQTLGAITSSGVLADTINAFADGFLRLFDASQHADGLVRFVAGVASVVSHIPDMLSAAGGAISHFFEVIGHNVEALMDRMDYRLKLMGMRAETMVESLMRGASLASAGDFAGARKEFSAMGDRLLAIDMVASAFEPKGFKQMDFSPYRVHPLDRQDEYQRRMQAFMGPIDNTVPDARGDWLSRMAAGQEEEQGDIKDIRDNTRKTAMELGNLRRQVLGGGDRAQIGATAAELRGGGAPFGSTVPLGGFGRIPVEVLLKFNTPEAQRFVRVEHGRAAGRGFNPR